MKIRKIRKEFRELWAKSFCEVTKFSEISTAKLSILRNFIYKTKNTTKFREILLVFCENSRSFGKIILRNSICQNFAKIHF